MSRNYQNSDEFRRDDQVFVEAMDRWAERKAREAAAAAPKARPWAPGPWCVTTCADYWVEPAEPPDDDGFYGIAHCGDIDWPGHEQKQREWEANARLISASPDLFEALAALVEHYTAMINSGDCGNWNPEDEAPVKAARAALAKANPEKGAP